MFYESTQTMVIYRCREDANEKGKIMGETGNANFCGTVKQLKKWLKQFDDDDFIEFEGGEDYEGEFFEIRVNDEIVFS